MSGRTFNRCWLLTVLGLCLLQILVAVIADPYCVYGIIRYPKRNFEPNTRVLKVEYLQRHPEYDAFILGSSRASFYDTEVADIACGDRSRHYNLNASLENGSGMRRKLEWLTSARRVRQVIVNVDFDLQSVPLDPFDLLRQEHPLVSGSSYLTFYAKYLLFQPRILYLYVRANLRKPKGEPWNDGNTATPDPIYFTRPFFDLSRLYDVTAGAIAHDLSHARPGRDIGSAAGDEEFRRTIGILDRAGTDRILIVPPYRLDQFASFHIDAFTEWMRKMVRIAGALWSFAGYNAVTANPSRYVDGIHFDRETGARILRRACGDIGSGDDFGVYVTAANLEQHIGALRHQHAMSGEAASRIDWNRR